MPSSLGAPVQAASKSSGRKNFIFLNKLIDGVNTDCLCGQYSGECCCFIFFFFLYGSSLRLLIFTSVVLHRTEVRSYKIVPWLRHSFSLLLLLHRTEVRCYNTTSRLPAYRQAGASGLIPVLFAFTGCRAVGSVLFCKAGL